MQEIYLHLHGYILHVTKTLIYRTFKTLQGKWRQKGRELRARLRTMTPEERSEIARRAGKASALKRWGKKASK